MDSIAPMMDARSMPIVNGAGNVIRKVAPDAFSEVEGVEDGKDGELSQMMRFPRIIARSQTNC